jgi:hypothetical protein
MRKLLTINNRDILPSGASKRSSKDVRDFRSSLEEARLESTADREQVKPLDSSVVSTADLLSPAQPLDTLPPKEVAALYSQHADAINAQSKMAAIGAIEHAKFLTNDRHHEK